MLKVYLEYMKKPTEAQIKKEMKSIVSGMMNSDCCGQPQDTGFDVMTHSNRDFEQVTENAYYAQCMNCGNIDILSPAQVRDDAISNLTRW